MLFTEAKQILKNNGYKLVEDKAIQDDDGTYSIEFNDTGITTGGLKKIIDTLKEMYDKGITKLSPKEKNIGNLTKRDPSCTVEEIEIDKNEGYIEIQYESVKLATYNFLILIEEKKHNYIVYIKVMRYSNITGEESELKKAHWSSENEKSTINEISEYINKFMEK